MNLHISHDDKFIDYFIIRQRSNFSDSDNQYLIYTDSDKLRFVKSEGVLVVKLYSTEFWKIINDKIIKNLHIHYFNSNLARLVLNIRPEVKIYWIFYGSDGFYLPEILKNDLDSYSLNYIKYNQPHLILNYFNVKGFLSLKWRLKVINHIKAIQRIDYFCHYIEADYQIIRAVTNFKANLLEFNYLSIEDIAVQDDKLIIQKNEGANSIFLGNSASESNNHISALFRIKSNNLEFDKIYCPLSYAGFKGYVTEVIKVGKKLFGKRFYPLTEYMNKQSYDSILKCCKIFINNHYRSQAYGNIGWQIYAGGEVVMNSKSTLYKYLMSNGIKLSDINNEISLIPMEKKVNYSQKIEDLISEDNVISRYSNLFK